MGNFSESILWVEKYRPHHIDDENLVLDDDRREKFKSYIDNEEVPSLLLVGAPGSGKTTMARIITDRIIRDPDDMLLLNGSSENGIGIVRNTIEPFLMTDAIESKFKIVYIEEADQLSMQAQRALRNIIEKYYDVGRFIFTANYITQFDEAILSRMDTYKFNKLDPKMILELYMGILEKEGVKSEESHIKKIVSIVYPDVRRGITMMQKLNQNGQITLSNLADAMDNSDKLAYDTRDIIMSDEPDNQLNMNNIFNYLNADDVDIKAVFNKLFSMKAFSPVIKTVVNKYASTMRDAFSLEMHFISMIWEARMSLKRYNEILRK
jgi:DNA polymerase III delta prime subunit